MTTQRTMFDVEAPVQYDDIPLAPVRGEAEARARKTDPASSHAAAEAVNRSGRANVHRWRVTDLVWLHPGCTSKELVAFTDDKDKADGIDRHEIARRLPEAEENGDVHRREGGKELTWWPGGKP